MNVVSLTEQDFASSPMEHLRVGQALSCEKVFFRYTRKTDWVINDFSHAFSPGITLIKGASGCGKSTLLRIMA